MNEEITDKTVDITINGIRIGTSECIFYTCKSEPIRVDKTDYLTLRYSCKVIFLTPVDILTPSLVIKYDNSDKFLDFNYVFIDPLKRYYYITNITSLKKNLWQIDTKIDILMSYKNGIARLQGFVDRNENDYDPKIIDNNRVIQQGNDISVIDVPNNLFNQYSLNNFLLIGYDIFGRTQNQLIYNVTYDLENCYLYIDKPKNKWEFGRTWATPEDYRTIQKDKRLGLYFIPEKDFFFNKKTHVSIPTNATSGEYQYYSKCVIHTDYVYANYVTTDTILCDMNTNNTVKLKWPIYKNQIGKVYLDRWSGISPQLKPVLVNYKALSQKYIKVNFIQGTWYFVNENGVNDDTQFNEFFVNRIFENKVEQYTDFTVRIKSPNVPVTTENVFIDYPLLYLQNLTPDGNEIYTLTFRLKKFENVADWMTTDVVNISIG